MTLTEEIAAIDARNDAHLKTIGKGIDDLKKENTRLREALETARSYVEPFVERDSSGESAADLALIDEALSTN